MDSRNQLTLVIPTYNRPLFLMRLLNYYRKRATNITFLVLDSSKPEIAEENALLISTIDRNFRYIGFPSSLQVAKKLSSGLDLVETPYCAFCADDDLVFLDALMRAQGFLQENPDYVCADGIYLNFNQIGTDIHLVTEYASRGIDAEHPGARIFRLFQKYESMFYGVFRTPDLKEIFSFAKDIPSLHFQELFQATAALIKGKSYRFPEFFACRQNCKAAEPERTNWQTFYWFASNPDEFVRNYRLYCDDLWRFYQLFGSEPRMNKEIFFKTMDLSHAVFFATECPPIYFHSVLQDEWPGYIFRKPGSGNLLEDVKTSMRIPLDDTLLDALSWFHRQISVFLRHIEFKRSRSLKSLVSLNEEVQKTCQTAWVCHLQSELCWLATVPQFRSAYFELCHYLQH